MPSAITWHGVPRLAALHACMQVYALADAIEAMKAVLAELKQGPH